MAPNIEEVDEQDITWQAEDDHGEDDDQDAMIGGPLAYCRGSLWSALWYLARGRGAAGPPKALPTQEQFFKPVTIQAPASGAKPLEGTLPHKAVQLTKPTAARELHLGFSWSGQAELRGLCFMLGPKGELRGTVSDSDRGGLAPLGVQLVPPLGRGVDNLIGLDKGAFKLRLDSVPEDVYACVFAVSAEYEGSERGLRADALLRCSEATVRLSTGPFEPHFWRQKNPGKEKKANVWVHTILYRGTFGGWRLEPLNMRLMMLALQDIANPTRAIEEVATTLAWRLRYLLEDRRWQAASDERGLRRDCPK